METESMRELSTSDSSDPAAVLESKTGPTPPPKKMSMALINFWLDAALFLAIVTVLWITVILQIIFPAPTQAAGWKLWGLTYDQWHHAQFLALCVSGLLIIEHLVLHWNWVCSVIATQVLRKSRPDEGTQAVFGVGLFIGVILVTLVSLIAALFSVQSGPLQP